MGCAGSVAVRATLAVVRRLLTGVAFLVSEHRLSGVRASVVVGPGS